MNHKLKLALAITIPLVIISASLGTYEFAKPKNRVVIPVTVSPSNATVNLTAKYGVTISYNNRTMIGIIANNGNYSFINESSDFFVYRTADNGWGLDITLKMYGTMAGPVSPSNITILTSTSPNTSMDYTNSYSSLCNNASNSLATGFPTYNNLTLKLYNQTSNNTGYHNFSFYDISMSNIQSPQSNQTYSITYTMMLNGLSRPAESNLTFNILNPS